MNIGVIGLGQMGAGMAQRLLEAGFTLTVWNRDRAKTAPLAERGAHIAATPADAARTGLVLSMLANDEAVGAVTFGEHGILSAGPNVLAISCSTVGVDVTERLTEAHHQAGQRFVSAQVLGRPDVAASGALTVIAAGPTPALDAAQPAFDAIGRNTVRIGDRPAMAAAAKAALNFGIAGIIEIISEQFRIVGAQGVTPETMTELLKTSDFGARIFASYAPIIVASRFEPAGFPLTLGRKDIGLAIAAANGAPLPLADLLATRADAAIAAGRGAQDWASLGQ